jgi:hypothetical protein
MVLNLPLNEYIDNTQDLVTIEKRKRKESNKRNLNKRSKAKERQRARSLEEDKSRTLRQGQQLDTSETKLRSSKERKPPFKSSNTTKSSPCTYASSP